MLKLSTATAAAALSLSLGLAAQAQTTTAGAQTGVTGRDVSAGTYTSGTSTQSPDGYSVGVNGGGTASAANGGTAATEASAKVTDRRAMQKSTATASDEDERARSKSRTMVQPNGTVRSRSRTFYKADGERPVIERDYSTSSPTTAAPSK